MKKTLLIIALIACIALMGCQPVAPDTTTAPPASQTPYVDAIKAAGKIVMLTNAQFPPFEYLADDNSYAGVDVDIANEIANDLGVELEVVNMDFDGIVMSVQTGKGDFGAAGMTVRPDREELVSFTVKYVKSSQYIIVQASDSSINGADDLADKLVGVQEGTSGDFFATDDIARAEGANPEDFVRRYKDALTASMALSTGKIDAVITDELPAKSIVANNSALRLIDEVLTEEEYAICVAKEKTDLLEAINATLNRLISEGKIEEFIMTHMAIGD